MMPKNNGFERPSLSVFSLGVVSFGMDELRVKSANISRSL